MISYRFTFAICAALALMLGVSSAVSALQVESAVPLPVPWRHGVCTELTFRVALNPDQPRTQKIHGVYCIPRGWQLRERQLDILTAGATYSHLYWNWPQTPLLYSYVEKTLRVNRSVFIYDRLGSGKSSHPSSTLISMDADAYILHELISHFYHEGYKRINSIGHSYGSGIAMHEAAVYQDVGCLVLTGYLHAPRNAVVADATYPAAQDPQFAGQELDNGYLTTKPGTRATSFYSASADPGVIAFDEAHKDLVSATGFGGFFGDRTVAAGSNLSNSIKAPVLLVVGELDATGCFQGSGIDCTHKDAVLAHEKPYYTSAASLEVDTIADTGHDLTLHPTAEQSFEIINSWLNKQ
ncbi:MAG TPA: alpha/beta fold hydrolase [Rickettsiales bacterium]|nr:alpha/beta fold hydrolase [Rickettsiales bacterium]